MTAIRDSLAQYVAVRRALGASFYEPALALGHFVDLLEREGAEFITSDLALRWATTPVLVERATWGRRLSQVRGFARWMSVIDSRNQIPPTGFLSARRRRNAPHIYSSATRVAQRRNSASLVPFAEEKISNAPHASARGCDEPVASRRRPDRDRALAWSRIIRNNSDLLARRHAAQGTRACARHGQRHRADTLQTSRSVARLPGGSLIMQIIRATRNRDPPNRCACGFPTRHNPGVGITGFMPLAA